MDQIAFIYGEVFIYWNPILLVMAAVTAILFFWAFYLGKSGNAVGAAAAVPMAMILSLVLARLVHWYCRTNIYESLTAAVSDMTTGGFALMGVFAGCILTAVVLRLLRISRNLPEMLDCMAIAGSAGIAVGRLAAFFNTTDRGGLLTGFTKLPIACAMTNAVSGAVEYRFATFLFQAMAAGVIFLLLTLVFLFGQGRRKLKSGDIMLLFLLLYGASQVVLDSTRTDSLYLRSNGFVSIVQILGAVSIVLAVVCYSVRMVRATGWKVWYPAIWVLLLALIGGAGYMEYHVQRHGNEALFAYSVMSACLTGVILLTLIIRSQAIRGERRKHRTNIYPV